MNAAPPAGRGRFDSAVWACLGVFLALNLAFRIPAFRAGCDGSLEAILALAALALVAAAGMLRPSTLGGLLQLLGSSLFLTGFHSYRLSSQLLELGITVLALVALVRLWRVGAVERSSPWPLRLLAAYAAIATLSLLLLPARVLEHRLFIEGTGIGSALVSSFPRDPLYPIASVDRLWLYLGFAVTVAAQPDGRTLFRRLFRGVATAALLAVLLGLLDFVGAVPLQRYNLGHLFYGASYRRLQSTFGNPGWFACFVACAVPFLWLEFRESAGRKRLALALVFPLCAASLLLSAARAAWLATLVVLIGLAVAALVRRARGAPPRKPDAAAWLGAGSTLAMLAFLGLSATMTSSTVAQGTTAPGRLEGLSREIGYRGLGLTSPRRVAIAYALELARLKPLLGLGYESFNMHLRAQLEQPGSGVARIVNSAVAADPSETVFDDSHDTYLQILAGTGALGLALWLLGAAAAILAAARAFLDDGSPEAFAALLGLAVFHFYGLFQGMAYLPVTFFPGVALAGYASVLARPAGNAEPTTRSRQVALVLLAVLVLAAAGYARDNGYAGLKRRFAIAAYLPDEAAIFEGFYRPEAGAGGEFRWMADRAIVNLSTGRPFRLRFTCEHADAERDPVVLSLRFEGRDVGRIVFRRPGVVEQRFALGTPGTLRLRVSRTFEPSGGDRRRLGVAVSAIRWE